MELFWTNLKQFKVFGASLVGVGLLNSMGPLNIYFLDMGGTYVMEGVANSISPGAY